MKTLYLSVTKAPFDAMVTGEKPFEIRRDSKWIRSRLFNPDGSRKEYDVVKVTNGYGEDKPCFIAKFIDIDRFVSFKVFSFSNGFNFMANEGDWLINFGEIIERGNIKEIKK